MGERRKGALRVKFDGELKLEFHGAKISSDTGLLVYHELDETLGLTTEVESVIGDSKTQKTYESLIVYKEKDLVEFRYWFLHLFEFFKSD